VNYHYIRSVRTLRDALYIPFEIKRELVIKEKRIWILMHQFGHTPCPL